LTYTFVATETVFESLYEINVLKYYLIYRMHISNKGNLNLNLSLYCQLTTTSLLLTPRAKQRSVGAVNIFRGLLCHGTKSFASVVRALTQRAIQHRFTSCGNSSAVDYNTQVGCEAQQQLTAQPTSRRHND